MIDAQEQARLWAAFQAFAERHDLSHRQAGLELGGDHKLAGRIQAGRVTYRTGNALLARMASYGAEAAE